MTVFPDNKVEYKYNEEKDKIFSPFGDSVGIQDVIVDGIQLSEGDLIYVKDSYESRWILAEFNYAHDNEVYAKLNRLYNATSWRYAKMVANKETDNESINENN